MTLLPDIEIVSPTTEIDPDVLSLMIRTVASIEPLFPPGSWTMNVRLTSDREISNLHEKFFSDPSSTDVITFPDGESSFETGHLGDVVISIDTARLQADDVGQSLMREVVFLAVHGLLHLCGYRDDTAESQARMLNRQEELIQAAEHAIDTGL